MWTWPDVFAKITRFLANCDDHIIDIKHRRGNCHLLHVKHVARVLVDTFVCVETFHLQFGSFKNESRIQIIILLPTSRNHCRQKGGCVWKNLTGLDHQRSTCCIHLIGKVLCKKTQFSSYLLFFIRNLTGTLDLVWTFSGRVSSRGLSHQSMRAKFWRRTAPVPLTPRPDERRCPA